MTAKTKLVVHTSSRRHVNFLNRLNCPERGVIVIRTRAGTRRAGWIYRDILSALGKTSHITGSSPQTTLTAATTAAWLKAHRIEHVLILDAGLVIGRILAETCDLLEAADVTAWICVEGHITKPVAETMEGRNVELVDRRAFDRTFAQLPTASRSDEPRRAFPSDVPASSFPTFLEDSVRLLGPNDYASVSALYAHTKSTIERLLAVAGSCTDLDVVALLRDVTTSTRSRSEVTTVVRAYQQAVFEQLGIFVVVYERRLVHDAAIEARAAFDDSDTWRRVQAYRQPFRGAAAASLAAGLSINEMLEVRIDEWHGDTIIYEGCVYRLPASSRVFIEALVWERRYAGAQGTDLLFAADGTLYTDRYLADAIAVMRAEIGVNLYGHELPRQHLSVEQWSSKYVKSMTRIRSAS